MSRPPTPKVRKVETCDRCGFESRSDMPENRMFHKGDGGRLCLHCVRVLSRLATF